MAPAPAMTLNSTYHWAPSAISTMQPQFSEMPEAPSTTTASGKTKLVGKEARTCTTGWAIRLTLGFIPIHAPMGTHTRVEKATSSSTRP